jgi:hypothetical protein
MDRRAASHAGPPRQSTGGLPWRAAAYPLQFPTKSPWNVPAFAAKIQAAVPSAAQMKPKTRELAAGMVLLWALLTGFFWLGFWVGGQEQINRGAANDPDTHRMESASPRPESGPSARPEIDGEAATRDEPARL